MPYTLPGTVLAVALLPAHVLGQVAPPSAPVPADDLAPYAGTYTISTAGVAKATYLDVLQGHLQADGDPFGARADARNRLSGEIERLEANRHDTVVHNRDGHPWVVNAPPAAADGAEGPGTHPRELAGDPGTAPADLGGAERGGEPGLHPLARSGRARVG